MSGPTVKIEVPEYLREYYEPLLMRPREEVAFEYAQLLYLLENALPDVKPWADALFKTVRVVRRDFKEFVGLLVGVQFEARALRLMVEEKVPRWGETSDLKETKQITIPMGSMIHFDIIYEQIEIPKKEGQIT